MVVNTIPRAHTIARAVTHSRTIKHNRTIKHSRTHTHTHSVTQCYTVLQTPTLTVKLQHTRKNGSFKRKADSSSFQHDWLMKMGNSSQELGNG